MKRNAIVRICIYSLLIFLLLGLLLSAIGVKDHFARSHSREETYTPRRVDDKQTDRLDPGTAGSVSGQGFPATVTSIEISWAAGDITLQTGDVDEILVSVDEDPEEEPARIRVVNGRRLEIDFVQDTDWFFGLNDLSEKDLTITVPKGFSLQKLELDIASAQVDIRDLTIDEVDIDGASGICTLENCDVRTLNVDTASGDVKFSGSLDNLDFDAASADFTGTFEDQPKSLKMDSMSGDLDLTLPEISGFTASIDALSSEFRSEFDTKTVNGAYVHGDGSCRIEVNGMSGNIDIRKAEK